MNFQMISTKLYNDYDEYFTISDWAKELNVPDEILKKMELDYLTAIVSQFCKTSILISYSDLFQEWNVHISKVDFFNKLEQIEQILAKREGLKRGWLTYTELLNFLPSFTFAKFILSNFAVMAASYCATVMTIAGAFFIASQIPVFSLERHNKNTSSLEKPTLKTVQSEIYENCTQNSEKHCSVINLNIEEELKKLEAEYVEEDQREAIRQKYNENTGPLINFNQNMIPLPRANIKEYELNYLHIFRHDDNYVEPPVIANNNCSNTDFCNFGFYTSFKNNFSNSLFPHLSLFKFI